MNSTKIYINKVNVDIFKKHRIPAESVFDFEKTSYEPRTQELFRSATYSFLNTDFDVKYDEVDKIVSKLNAIIQR
jgi:hypothetical protein